jgi:hypothetical protein
VARFIASVVGNPATVLDPTAGAGSLLVPYAPESRFGIEIDEDHARAAKKGVERRRANPGATPAADRGPWTGGAPASGPRGEDDLYAYHAIQGDAQKVVPMLRAAGATFDAVVLNPPFGLQWRDPVHTGKGETNSTALAFLWAMDLLDRFGQGAMVSGRDRLFREVLGRPEAKGIYAIVEVVGQLFDSDVALPCAISFFRHPHKRTATPCAARTAPFASRRAGRNSSQTPPWPPGSGAPATSTPP